MAAGADITVAQVRDTGTTARVIADRRRRVAGVTGAAIMVETAEGIAGTMAAVKVDNRQAIRRAAGHRRLAVHKEAGRRRQVILDSRHSR